MDWLTLMRAEWRKFFALSGQEKWLLAVSMILLPVFALAHRLLGLRRAQGALNRCLPGRGSLPCPVSGRPGLARSASRIVEIAAHRGPWRITCLEQSVYLRWLLARHGVATTLRIGVRKADGRFEAHAWVELLGEVLNDSTDVGARFAPFSAR